MLMVSTSGKEVENVVPMYSKGELDFDRMAQWVQLNSRIFNDQMDFRTEQKLSDDQGHFESLAETRPRGNNRFGDNVVAMTTSGVTFPATTTALSM